MKAISPRHLRATLPVVIADDLRLIIPSIGRGVQLSPREATAVGCRLIRQASVVDRTLAKKSTKRNKSSR